VEIELCCVAPLDASLARVRGRSETASQVTPEIAVALADRGEEMWTGAHRIDTTAPQAKSVELARRLCTPTT
jgi:hypothetical protein